MKKIVILFLSATLAVVSSAQEPNVPKKNKRADMSMFSNMDPSTRLQLMKQFDKNGDGRLDAQEREAARKSMKEKKIDLAKLKEKHVENVIKKFDKDGDGKLDSNEVASFLEEQRKMLDERRSAMMRRNNRKPPAEILAKFDKNGDGKLDAEERKAIRKDAMQRRKALFDKYDQDKDGKFSDAEKEQVLNDKGVREMMKRMLDRTPPPQN